MARITKAVLVRLQKSLKCDQAIGDKFGITRQAVHQLRKKYGISAVTGQNPERNKGIAAAYKSGKPVAAIAKKYNVSVSYAYRIIAENRGRKKRGRR